MPLNHLLAMQRQNKYKKNLNYFYLDFFSPAIQNMAIKGPPNIMHRFNWKLIRFPKAKQVITEAQTKVSLRKTTSIIKYIIKSKVQMLEEK